MNYFSNEILFYFLNLIDTINHINYFTKLIVFFISGIFLYSLPIPGAILIIINNSIFGFVGFFISYVSCNISAIVFYIIFGKIIKNNKNYSNTLTKFISYKNNFYMLLTLRIFIPFFVFTYVATFLKVDFKKFIYCTILGTFPGTFSISLFVSRIKINIIAENGFSIYLFKDVYFLISIFCIFILVFIAKYLKNRKLI